MFSIYVGGKILLLLASGNIICEHQCFEFASTTGKINLDTDSPRAWIWMYTDSQVNIILPWNHLICRLFSVSCWAPWRGRGRRSCSWRRAPGSWRSGPPSSGESDSASSWYPDTHNMGFHLATLFARPYLGHKESSFKGTVLRDRFWKCWRKLTDTVLA